MQLHVPRVEQCQTATSLLCILLVPLILHHGLCQKSAQQWVHLQSPPIRWCSHHVLQAAVKAVGRAAGRAVGRAEGRAVGRAVERAVERAMGKAVLSLPVLFPPLQAADLKGHTGLPELKRRPASDYLRASVSTHTILR